MSTGNCKPIIFLAFANDRDDLVRYLRNLPDEARRIRQALERAAREGLCEVVERPNATLKDILDVFQDPDRRNRIAVFHYGGHASGCELLLESENGQLAIADGKGLADFLGQQTGLQLVFLNGCATRPQVQGLLDARVSAVIATSSAIEDQVAMEFAVRFYQALAGGAELRGAYAEAAAAVQTACGGNPRNLYAVDEAGSDRWPWDIYVRPGAETIERWNLPDAAGNPLFGLPPVPEQDLPESPFRYLNWFGREHAEIFFGRGCQIRDLYQRVTEPSSAPIILFYGQSGVGKSSTLAAGLIPRLEIGQMVAYLRRDPKQGLLGMLSEVLRPHNPEESLREAWCACENQSGKPLTIILDQVEDAFTRPGTRHPNELSDFFDALAVLYQDAGRRPRGKLMLGFRKEWLAEIELHLVERKLPRAKVFLDRLDRCGIVEAVSGPARSERLRRHFLLDEVPGNLSEAIADDLLEDRESPIAPTLQILLTKLWEAAKQRDNEHLRFDLDLYHALKKQGILLKDFLDQQMAVLEKLQPSAAGLGLALDVLSFHTTALGSAEERSAEELENEYAGKAETVADLVGHCKDLYLLTEPQLKKHANSPRSRLAHDTLAPFVRRRFAQSDAAGQRARRILENRAVEWREGKNGNPLDEADLKLVEDGAHGMRGWTEAEKRLVEVSRDVRLKQGHARRRRRIFGIAAIAVIVVIAGIAVWKSREADQKATEANEQSRVAFSRQLAAQSVNLINKELDLSLLLSIESFKAKETVEARRSLRSVLNYNPRLQAFLPGNKRAVWSMVYLADGKVLASADAEGKISLWDVSDLRSVKPLEQKLLGHETNISSMVYLADSKVLVSADLEGKIFLWDVSDPRSVKQLEPGLTGHESGVLSMVYLADSKVLASADLVGRIFLWDVSDPRSVKQLEPGLTGHETGVLSMVFLADSKVLASAGYGGKILLWDVSDPRSVNLLGLGLLTHKLRVPSLAYLADSKVLASAGDDGKILLWDVSDLRSVKPLEPKLLGHETDISSMVYLADSKVLASADAEGKILLWDVSDLRSVKPLEPKLLGHETNINMVYLADSKVLASADYEGKILLWEVSEPKSVKSLDPEFPDYKYGVRNMVYLADSKVLALSYAEIDGTIYLWDVSDPRSVKPLESNLPGHKSQVLSMVYLADSKVLASADYEGTIYLWDVSDPRSVKPLESNLPGHKSQVLSMVYLADIKVLASVDAEGMIFLWDVSDPRSVKPLESNLPGHKSQVLSMVYLADIKVLASVDAEGMIFLWDVSDPRSVKPLESNLPGHKSQVLSMVYLADIKVLASADAEGMIFLWDVSDPRSVKPLESNLPGHKSQVLSMVYLADSKVLASADYEGMIFLWDVSDPRSVKPVELELLGRKSSVRCMVYLANSKVLASADDGGKIFLWDLDWSFLQRRACRIANRNLSRTEWNRYMGQFYGADNYHKTCPDWPDGD